MLRSLENTKISALPAQVSDVVVSHTPDALGIHRGVQSRVSLEVDRIFPVHRLQSLL